MIDASMQMYQLVIGLYMMAIPATIAVVIITFFILTLKKSYRSIMK